MRTVHGQRAVLHQTASVSDSSVYLKTLCSSCGHLLHHNTCFPDCRTDPINHMITWHFNFNSVGNKTCFCHSQLVLICITKMVESNRWDQDLLWSISYTHILPLILTLLYVVTKLLQLFIANLAGDGGVDLDIACWFTPGVIKSIKSKNKTQEGDV